MSLERYEDHYKADIVHRDQRKKTSLHSSEQSDEDGETIIVGDGADSKAAEATSSAPKERDS